MEQSHCPYDLSPVNERSLNQSYSVLVDRPPELTLREPLERSIPLGGFGPVSSLLEPWCPVTYDAHLDGKVFLAQNKVPNCAFQNQVDRSLYKSMHTINTCGVYWLNNPP